MGYSTVNLSKDRLQNMGRDASLLVLVWVYMNLEHFKSLEKVFDDLLLCTYVKIFFSYVFTKLFKWAEEFIREMDMVSSCLLFRITIK